MIAAFWPLLAGFLGGPPAWAHGMSGGQLVLRMAGDTVYVHATPSVAMFAQHDDDGDGQLGRTELAAHRDEILATFEQSLVLLDPTGETGERIFTDLGLNHAHGAQGSSGHVRFTLRYRWDQAPSHLDISYTRGSAAPLLVRAQEVSAERRLDAQRAIGPVLTANFNQPLTQTRLFGADDG